MERTDFYLSLPSNTRVTDNNWRKNTTSEFRVRLPEEIRLTGAWEVALVELIYPHSWDNVTYDNDEWTGSESNIMILKIYNPTGMYHSSIDAGHYDTAEALLNAIELCELTVRQTLTEKIRMTLNKEQKQLHQNDLDAFKPKLRLHYNRIRRRVTANGDGKWMIVLSQKLQYILGFQKKVLEAGDIARYTPDIRGGIDSLFVYCDLCEPQIIGNSTEQVVRIVPVSGQYGEVVDRVFVSPHYISVLKKSFSTVDISIKTDTDKPIPFQFGKCVVKLHFRKKR